VSADLIAAYFGARGQGKSTQAKAFLAARAPARSLIWDTMDEYAEHAELAASLAELHERARSGEGFRLRYVPPGAEGSLAARFDAFCAIAYTLGDLVLVVEELQRVTRPSWAPPAWSDCTLRGRHRRLSILGLSQRPASVDKNFFSNCNQVSSCRLNFADDIACMANVLGVAREAIGALPRFHFLTRNMETGEVSPGVTAELGRPPPAPRPARTRRRKKTSRRSPPLMSTRS